MARRGTNFTAREDLELVRLTTQNRPNAEIAKQLGRSDPAIRNRLYLLRKTGQFAYLEQVVGRADA